MIKINPKPKKKVETYEGEYDFDIKYNFSVEKHTNGETKYVVTDIQPQPDPAVEEPLKAAIVKYCNREGVGVVNANNNQ